MTIGPRGFSELIIQPPKIDFDILLGAKSVGSRGLFAKDQNHRFNQRFSTLLLLTFDFEGGTQQQHKASIALCEAKGTLAFLQLFLHPSSSTGRDYWGVTCPVITGSLLLYFSNGSISRHTTSYCFQTTPKNLLFLCEEDYFTKTRKWSK